MAFREKGHEAYSCDIIECSGGHPEWHIQGDVLKVLNPEYYDGRYGITPNISFYTMDGEYHQFDGKWDLIIAHPPCTYLTVTGNRWFNIEKYGDKAIQRYKDREKAIKFFLELANADCEKIVIENPIGVISTVWRKADQIINPTMFGDPFDKKTCLWLIGLKPLTATKIVEAAPRIKYESGKTMPAWYAEAWKLPKEERAKLRSKTFPGIASALAEQFTIQITGQNDLMEAM
jgi:hypothetical protein